MKNTLILLICLAFLSCKQKESKTSTEEKVTTKESKDASQTKKGPGRASFAEIEAKALKEAYKGIFVENETVENLFPIKATGISTDTIVKAAKNFLSNLSEQELKQVQFPIDDNEWRKWSNVDNGVYNRQGISLKAMTETQKSTAWTLLQTSLSAKGLQLTKDIMKTDQTLKELTEELDRFDEELYFLTIMGEPSHTVPWGWQFEGHHLAINYFVLGDQIVMSPVFMGAEPVFTTSGKYKGNTVFQDEQNLGLAFMQSLSKAQQAKATVSNSKTGNNNIAEANKDNQTLSYQGIQANELDNNQQKELLSLIAQYVNNIREGHQQIKMEEVTKHMDSTWFSWVGETHEDSVFYYRIHSPVILIEFDHQGAIAIKTSGSRDRTPTRNHIHTNVRTPNGNDYGKDLLRQHIEKHHKH